MAGFAASRQGVDPAGGLSVLDWLVLTGQSVLEVTAGPLFTDQSFLSPAAQPALRLTAGGLGSICVLDRDPDALRLYLAHGDANLEDSPLVADGDVLGVHLGGQPELPGERAVTEL